MLPKGPDNFSHADFSGSFCRTGGRKVHEIETGDQKNKGRHSQKDVDVHFF